MKNIQKGREPPALTQHRQAGGSFEDPGPWKHELRRALLREQGALCCYCMNRIELESLRIEHLRPQHEHRAQQLTHRNLLAACPGGQDNPTHEQRDIRHCDVRKGASPLALDPVAGVEHRVRYGFVEGRIFGADPEADRDLDQVLGLNAPHLRQLRRRVIEGLIARLRKKYSDKTWSRAALEREIARWSSRDGHEFRPFCQVAVEFLRKQLPKART
jgi:uncharacterized protein (TIGR02646 family)